MRQHIDELEAELVGERARREGVERRDKILQAQIAKEADTQLGLQRERDSALDEIAALKGTVAELTRARSEAEARKTDTLQQVAALKVTVDEVTRARSDAEQRLSKLRQTKAKEIVQSISPFVIAAAVATVGIWTYQLIWRAPQPLPAIISNSTSDLEAKLNAAELEQQRLTEQVQRQEKVAAEAQTKLQAAQAELQNQAKAATDADSKRKTAEDEQQRLKAELQRQAKAAADADTARKAAEDERQRLAAKLEEERKATATARPSVVPAAQPSPALPQPAPAASAPSQSTPTVMASTLFEIRRNTEAFGSENNSGDYVGIVVSLEDCEQKCRQSTSCNAFAFSKSNKGCFLYPRPELKPHTLYDSGVRQAAAPPTNQSTTTATKAPFEIRTNVEARGKASTDWSYLGTLASRDECQQKCTQLPQCNAFTFSKATKSCHSYANAEFLPNPTYDSGVRQSAALGAGPPVSEGSFEIRRNTSVRGALIRPQHGVSSIEECEKNCRENVYCKFFSYTNKADRNGANWCVLYQNSGGGFIAAEGYDAGIRR